MIEIEKKVKLNELENGGTSGLYVIRVATRVPMTAELARSTVINHIKNEVEARYNREGSSSYKKDGFLKDLEVLSRIPILYHKVDKYEKEEYGQIEYHQIVLDLPEEEKEQAVKRNSVLGSIAGQLVSSLYNIYGDVWKIPQCPMSDFVYTLSEIKPDRRVNVMMISNNDARMKKFIDMEYKPNNHIAVSIDANTTKCYNRSSIIKMIFRVTDNLSQAFEARTNNTIGIDQYDGLFGRFSFFTYKEDRHGGLRLAILYKSKPKLVWHNDMAIFYDGDKSFEDAKPYFDTWAGRGIRQVDILQFCHNKDFFYQDSIGHDFYVNKLVLIFLNQDKISLSRSELQIRNSRGFYGSVSYLPGKNQKRIYVDVGMGGRSPNMGQYLGSIVIAVNDKDVQKESLRVVNNMIKITLPLSSTLETESFEDNYNIYRNCLFGLAESKPDTLSEWFKYCTRASKQNDDNIVKAYERMKKSLEREYKELGTYLSHYDFSKCMPIPRIKTDEKMVENYYKSLHIEPKTVIINSINNRNIKSIQEIQPTVSFMFIDRRGRLLKGDYSINKFYNNKTNEVELLYNKLKGEVSRDKTQNRR